TTGYRGGGAGVWYSDNYGKHWEQIFKAPETECFAISPFDANLMVVTTKFLSKNPGIYLSKNRGQTWEKINKSIVIPHQIEDVKFDLHNPSELWLATKGGGFYKGKLKNGDSVQVVKVRMPVINLTVGEKTNLKADIVNANYKKNKLHWKSTNLNIAKVNKDGKVIALNKGKVKIWATTVDGRFSDYVVLTVK
ncbi:VPS10 domain-containing protein, partial [Ochrovirga pacifica]|uniref:VPS10 domain-containing protein n=1 Tax=Ochrovirga pacifica TaxID=1042376 RepID=UPI0002557BE6